MSWRPCLLVSDRPEIAGLRTSLASFQWFAATLPTALIPTPLTLQKNANKPLRRTLLPKLLARFVRKGVHRPTNRCVTALYSTFPCSLFSSMFSFMRNHTRRLLYLSYALLKQHNNMKNNRKIFGFGGSHTGRSCYTEAIRRNEIFRCGRCS